MTEVLERTTWRLPELQTQPPGSASGLSSPYQAGKLGESVQRWLSHRMFSPLVDQACQGCLLSSIRRLARWAPGPLLARQCSRSQAAAQGEGYHPASAHSSPLTTGFKIMKQIASAIASGRIKRRSCVWGKTYLAICSSPITLTNFRAKRRGARRISLATRKTARFLLESWSPDGWQPVACWRKPHTDQSDPHTSRRYRLPDLVQGSCSPTPALRVVNQDCGGHSGRLLWHQVCS
jgi:hypothetical protein